MILIFVFQNLSIDESSQPLIFAEDALRGLCLLKLRITNCQLQAPPALTHVKTCLIFLNLNRNCITFIPDQYFSGCTYLSEIFLQSNRLMIIPNIAYVSRTVMALHVAQNDITEVTTLYGLFLPRMVQFTLDSNAIQSFCMPPHSMWPSLTRLLLGHNNLSSFYLPPWGGLTVALWDNPIHCNNTMGWVQQCEKGREMPRVLTCGSDDTIYGLTCASPPSMSEQNPLDQSKSKFSYQWPLLLTWFNLKPALMNNFIHHKVWDEISYPFLNFNGATVEV